MEDHDEQRLPTVRAEDTAARQSHLAGYLEGSAQLWDVLALKTEEIIIFVARKSDSRGAGSI